MSETAKHIEDLFKNFSDKDKKYSSICKVVSVNETDRTCEVEPINGDAERTGRLQTSLQLTSGIYIKPSIDSYVLLSWINNTTGIITAFSAIDNIEIKTIDGGSLSLGSKFNFSNSDADLLTVLVEILTAIKQITVPTPAGTSGVPLNIASFETAETNLKKILE